MLEINFIFVPLLMEKKFLSTEGIVFEGDGIKAVWLGGKFPFLVTVFSRPDKKVQSEFSSGNNHVK